MTSSVRTQLAGVARRNKWDADALYAVVSLASGRTFRPDAGVELWTPQRTGVGLLRFSEVTARRLGVAPSPHPPAVGLASYQGRWATWAVALMSVDDQIDLLEAYLVRAFGDKKPRRPVDYYLAAWGAAPGLPDSTVIAVGGDRTFEENRELDRDADERIAVADLSHALSQEMRRTGDGEPGPLYDVLWSVFLFGITRRFLP